MHRPNSLIPSVAAIGAGLALFGCATGEPVRLAGMDCADPPILHCPEANCPAEVVTNGGPVVEPKTGRTYFLDYPCDLKKDEKVTVVLSLHGFGSYGNWQRNYFPLMDYKDEHRLVIATPYSPAQMWTATDDEYLQNIVTSLIGELGPERIKAFWLAGHSQGGITSTRLVCTDFFKDKVDGYLSLSSTRMGGQPAIALNPPPAPGAATPPGRAGAPGGPPAAAGGRGGAFSAGSPPTCDFSHIYETGEHELTSGMPTTSTWAQKYGCGDRVKKADIVDTKPGYVFDGTRQNPPTLSWGRLPRGGKAEVYVYPNCRDGKVVADVVRLDKGHTEGLEPRITEELIKLMTSARGGKISGG